MAGDLLSTPQAGPTAIRGGALRVLSFAGGSLFAIVGGALLFRHLGVVDGGRYMTALSLSAIVTGFTDLGLTAIGMRELATLGGAQRAQMARTLLGIRLVVTLVGVLLMGAFAFAAYGTTLGIGVLVAGAGVLVANVQATLAVPLMAELRLGWVSALDFVRQVVGVLFIVVLVVAGATLLPFLAIPALAAAIVLVPTALLVRGDIPLRPSFDLGEWRALAGPVLTYSIAVAAATLYLRAAIIIVSLLASGHQLGLFSLGFRVVEVLLLVPGLLVGAAFPIFARAARDDPARLGYALSRVFEVSLIVGAWVALALAIGAPLVVEIMGGRQFAAAAPVLAIQAVVLGATFVNAVWGYGMLSLHLHRTILALSFGLLAAVVVVVAVLVPIDGARGAAIGTAAVEVVAAVVGGFLLVRGRPHLRPRLQIVPKVALAAALGAAPAFATELPVSLRVVLASLVYGAVLLALRAFPRELDALLSRRPA
ncbi:MAG TPA: oligosaccharide flippase family protein [Solirubrobacteraceae bacterium]|nr:oligosaccharide flippase family protein [Solirubrobacteraceae bacterium]